MVESEKLRNGDNWFSNIYSWPVCTELQYIQKYAPGSRFMVLCCRIVLFRSILPRFLDPFTGTDAIIMITEAISTSASKVVIVQHYSDVIMTEGASQITSLTTVYSAVYSSGGQRKHQRSASLAFVLGIHRGPVNSPHKWPVTRKMLPFDDVIMKTHVAERFYNHLTWHAHYIMLNNWSRMP